ncbi:c-type cytochrome [Deinococcus cellulosilyticus]|uniref:Cytochrome c domain-containing protein n=1 Tax=Deinococcus cellulosilyticus (strain DSM 18568 / NBRC 106333 / KACC 11606 / 5516J-15) TaxID=1223518 RepID=A0A511N355_DEIC1|nr:cytochrome c [Deinococcus cellulosilyticus]GEM47283.1 hypothetical protein DC3_29180 [Deinococcus cellulosilyticus NBRC 106333 = KACC 11606]
MSWRMLLVFVSLSCAAGAVFTETETLTPRPTYQKDTQPILQKHCVACHSTGGIAPFSLESFQAAASRADLIAYVTTEKIMPPWMPGGKTPPLKNERKLTDHEIQTLALWAAAGAPEK